MILSTIASRRFIASGSFRSTWFKNCSFVDRNDAFRRVAISIFKERLFAFASFSSSFLSEGSILSGYGFICLLIGVILITDLNRVKDYRIIRVDSMLDSIVGSVDLRKTL